MTEDNLIQPGGRVSESVYEEFKQNVRERHGKLRGHLGAELENAMRAYIQAAEGGDTHDRLRRLENMVEDIHSSIDSESGQKTKDSDFGTTVTKRLNKIEAQLQREAGESYKVHESFVNTAIEDHAGGSKPTLKQYKKRLQERHIAHKWPGDKSWWLDDEKFVFMLRENRPEAVHEFKEEWGREWFEQIEKEIEESDENPLGFQ